jgi:hypothetical protein
MSLGVISDIDSTVLMPNGDFVPYLKDYTGMTFNADPEGIPISQIEMDNDLIPIIPIEISNKINSFTPPGMINKEKEIAFYVPKNINDFDVVFGEDDGTKAYFEISPDTQKTFTPIKP